MADGGEKRVENFQKQFLEGHKKSSVFWENIYS